ncbi:hypothetical protein NS376_15980 [Pseudomonas oryzihabitans]|nr:hypothetical protein NS376_15980 [Pseudomonas psychrotolerans]
MQKISASTTTANAAGEFTEGNPGAGVEATLLKAAWLNSLQRELVAVVDGAGLALNPTDDGQLLKALKLIGVRGNQRITSSGNFIVPEGVYTVYLSGCAGGGGGGGGGGAINSSSTGAGGAGGSAGQSVIRQAVSVTPGQVIPVVIGAGGVGGGAGTPSVNGGTGGTGSSTTFGSLLTLTGGSSSSGGLSYTSTSNLPAGGSPGAGFPAGGYGSDGSKDSNVGVGMGGSGASTPFGGGGGAGRSGSSGVNGTAASGYGAGGGGAGGGYGLPSGGANGGVGGAGAPGFLVVEW